MRKLWPLVLISACFNPMGSEESSTESSASESTSGPSSGSTGSGNPTSTEATSAEIPTGTTAETPSTGSSSEATLGSSSEIGSSGVVSSTGEETITGTASTGGPVAVCGDGVVDPGEECEPPEAGCSPSCAYEVKYIFVSSQTKMGGALGTLEEVDALCQSLAEGQPIIGSRKFVAWLSDENTAAKDRIGTTLSPYKLPDNLTTVAANTGDLLDGTLQNAIVKDETATVILTDLGVWTGTMVDGQAAKGKTCLSWMGGQTGLIGQAAVVDSGWTADSQLSCSQPGRVYCIETAG